MGIVARRKKMMMEFVESLRAVRCLGDQRKVLDMRDIQRTIVRGFERDTMGKEPENVNKGT